MGDALGSVRQLVDPTGVVTLSQSYAPYGDTLNSVGIGSSVYQFTGEAKDSYITDRLAGQGLIYLRARYYAPASGRFITKDTWRGDYTRPLSLNRWSYVEGNPINLTDPSGKFPSYPEGWESGNEVLVYIVQRMREDANSEEIKRIRELNNAHYYENTCQYDYTEIVGDPRYYQRVLAAAKQADTNSRLKATAWFGCLVADALTRPVGCGQWDYKKEIGEARGYYQTLDFSWIGIAEKQIFY